MSHSCNYGLWPARLLCPCGIPARILEWVAISSSRASSHPRDQIHISCIAGRIFTTDPSEKHVFRVLDPYQISDFQIFSLFTFLMVSFETLKFYILMKSNWYVFSFIACTSGTVSKKPLPNSRSLRFATTFLWSILQFYLLHLDFWPILS